MMIAKLRLRGKSTKEVSTIEFSVTSRMLSKLAMFYPPEDSLQFKKD